MANWFTVQGPHPIQYSLAWDIYLQYIHKEIAYEIQVNDRIFFYELKGKGKLNIDNRDYKTSVGRLGLVHVGKVTGQPYNRSLEQGKSSSWGESSGYWSIGIPTDADTSSGFVDREKVVAVLGYKNNYYFKGFAGGAGIKQIDESQASQLLALFEGNKC